MSHFLMSFFILAFGIFLSAITGVLELLIQRKNEEKNSTDGSYSREISEVFRVIDLTLYVC